MILITMCGIRKNGRPQGRPFCFWSCPPKTGSRCGEIRGGFFYEANELRD
jgi:hypothetical protein